MRTTTGTSTKTTMMTTTNADDAERAARLTARVHRLSDPLAAMGQRGSGDRLRRERNARVILLALTLGATIGITGAIAAFTDPPAGDDTTAAYQTLPGSGASTVHVRSGSS
jgi:hypothetical protein